MATLKYRTVWISDVHLGMRACKAEYLLDFLQHVECRQLYLVGDMIDLWSMKRGIYWPTAHNQVVQRILEMAGRGTRVTFLPGNHDETFRGYLGSVLGGVRVQREVVHTTADGRRLLVLHGDEFDAVTLNSRWLALLGHHAYETLLVANRWFNAIRRRLGFPYWSLAAFLKHKVKNAVNFISQFEECVAKEARARGLDGVVCGHIHHATIQDFGGILYCNDGDWVE
jgi:UDP-2,3-diacylglucosamine pyrophosphatase LpxH